jgi:hypothetical protein
MAACQHQRHDVAIAFGARRDIAAGGLQGAEMRAKPLHAVQIRFKAFRQAKTRFSPEKQHMAARRRCLQRIGFERIEQGFEGIGSHMRLIEQFGRPCSVFCHYPAFWDGGLASDGTTT